MASSIEFKLFAPYNNSATLKGSFSEWSEISMQKDDQGYFRTTVELEDGIYQYKFRVQSKSWFLEPNEWVEVSDPYATNIDDASQNSAIQIKEGKKIVDRYVWQHDNIPLPSNEELVIYELFVGGFSGGESDSKKRGKFQDVVDKLDYLQELGINAVELMPIQEYPGDSNWGYNPRYYFAVESSYGSSEDLKHLIDECHGRGMRVVMDCIFNHSNAEAPLTQIDHDYWYRREASDPEYNWGPEFDYEHYDDHLNLKPAWQFIGDVVKFWIEEYHIDGIRYDASKQISNFDFLSWIAEQARKATTMKPFFNTAEYIPENPALVGYGKPMDACWHESFYQQALKHICSDNFNLEGLKEVIDCRQQGYTGTTNVINYISCHDHNYILAELGDRGIFGESAYKRAKLGAVLLMTAIGVPLVWMGNEFGEYNLEEEIKIDWSLLENELNQELFHHYQGLIALRKENHALRSNNIEFFYEDEESKVLAYTRWNDEGSRVVVIINFSDNFLADYTITHFPQSGTWHEWTQNYDVEAAEGKLVTTIGSLEAKVLIS
ncbi:alpha amylase C-terminal domain-containing protein [Pleurocapsales cyanobacterium LEGE 10410]|nr:alpha amylase C-terminal domain-containing protein [Pleurocapsales cyanobacterium LEGE 10410]